MTLFYDFSNIIFIIFFPFASRLKSIVLCCFINTTKKKANSLSKQKKRIKTKTHDETKVSNSHFSISLLYSCLLLDHFNESNDKSFVCALCLRRYSKLSCLKRHVRYECTKNPNRMSFKCPYCNHMSKRRDSLTQHILSLHQSRKLH